MENSNVPPRIDASLAGALRRTFARGRDRVLENQLNRTKRTGMSLDFVKVLSDGGVLFNKYRRGPAPGFRSGHDIVYAEHGPVGEIAIVIDSVDKRGQDFADRPGRHVLYITRHAVESLYQRLRTSNWKNVFEELCPVGSWLYENSHVVAMEDEGLLVTPTGVFPVIRGDRGKTALADARRHWIATTWIADEGLEDHTKYKARVAQAVKSMRPQRVGFTKVGV